MVIILAISMFIGGIVSCMYSFIQFKRCSNNSGYHSVDASQITTQNMINKGRKYVSSEPEAQMIIDFSGHPYINKLEYLYSCKNEGRCEVKIVYNNRFGVEDEMEIEDHYNPLLNHSVINIHKRVDRIELKYLLPEKGLKVYGFTVKNVFQWNPLLFLIVALGALPFVYFFFMRHEDMITVDATVAICVLSLGLAMLSLQPAFCSGWDEHIHFRNAFSLATIGQETTYSKSHVFFHVDHHWFNQNKPESLEEYRDLIQFGKNAEEIKEEHPNYDRETRPLSIGYIPCAVGIMIGRLTGMPFIGL